MLLNYCMLFAYLGRNKFIKFDKGNEKKESTDPVPFFSCIFKRILDPPLHIVAGSFRVSFVTDSGGQGIWENVHFMII